MLMSILLIAALAAILSGIYVRLPTTSYYLLATIGAAGASNLLDRLVFGGVRDVFVLGEVYFNVADIMIVGGVLGLVMGLFLTSR